MEIVLSASGFSFAPVTEGNLGVPRLTPAAVKFCNLLVSYLLTNADGTPSTIESVSARMTIPLDPSVGNLQTVIIYGIIKSFVEKFTQPRRYGLGDVAYLMLPRNEVSAFVATLPFSIRSVTLVGNNTVVDSENIPTEYAVGNPVSVNGRLAPSGDALHFAAGGCLAESITELTRGPLRYALCLDDTLLWWTCEFANFEFAAGNQDSYLMYFNDAIREQIAPVYEKYRPHNEVINPLVSSGLSVKFFSPVFLQGFSSFYLSNDLRYKVRSKAVGHLKIVGDIIMLSNGHWGDAKVKYYNMARQ